MRFGIFHEKKSPRCLLLQPIPGIATYCKNPKLVDTPNIQNYPATLENGHWLQSPPSGTPPPIVFYLFTSRRITSRLRALHIHSSQKHLLRFQMARLTAGIPKRFGNLWGKVLSGSLFVALRMSYKDDSVWTNIVPTDMASWTHSAEEVWVDVSCSGPIRNRRSRHSYRLQTRSESHHRWSRGAFCSRSCCNTTSRFDEFDHNRSDHTPVTAALRVQRRPEPLCVPALAPFWSLWSDDRWQGRPYIVKPPWVLQCDCMF